MKCWTKLDPSRSQRIWPAATGNASNATQWPKKMPNVWWCHPAVDKDHAQLLDSTMTRPLGGGECVGPSLLTLYWMNISFNAILAKNNVGLSENMVPLKSKGLSLILHFSGNLQYTKLNRETQLLSLSSIFHCFVCVIGAACVCMPPRSYCS